MRTMADGYSDAVASNSRDVSIYLSLGTNIDTTAADDISSISGGMLPLSNTSQAADAVYSISSGMATFEGDGIKTSVDAGNRAPPLSAHAYPPETGIWSDVISDADGAISWTLTITLSAEHTSAFRLYTDGPSITSASAVFTASDGTTTTGTFEYADGYAQVADAHTYISIAVTVSAISEAYHHIRIVECEFGASRSISTKETTGETSLIDEIDPTEASMPLRELDFELINVNGDYDPDNPDTRLGELAVGFPVSLSFTVEKDDSRYTVPMGRFVIGSRSSTETSIRITAYDARYALSDISSVWSLSTATSLGTSLDAILAQYDIPHYVEEAMFSLYPDADYTFSEDATILNDLLWIEQAYGVYFLPDRDGTIHVTTTWPTGDAGTVPTKGIYSWPSVKQRMRYNYISISYGSGNSVLYIEKDLRTDASETKSVLQLSNPLIASESRATTTLNRVVGRILADTVEVDWVGDPAMDLGDTISIPGRWTADAPLSYTALYSETTYNGLLRMITRASR